MPKILQMKKIIFLTIILLSSLIYAGGAPADKARGLFVSFGVGPRLPVDDFSRSTDVGYGFNVELSYTDNEYLPVFLFTRIGFEQYPGSQDFYESTPYSNFSTTSIPFNMGGRIYFSPMLENVVLFMPFIEVSGAFNYYSKLHQFKILSGRVNYSEDVTKIGASAGVGISMFLMEILASYNYFHSNQFLSVDLKVRLPLYIIF
jgi:hypothetical protein